MAKTTYKSSNVKDAVFSKAKTISGKNPDLYRQDPYGNMLYKHSYGKDTKCGWNIDHIKPQSRGGSHAINNLQALQSTINKSKGNTLVKKSRHKQ
jgi:5-methylcytosine-specific restriction endonuclease McrA